MALEFAGPLALAMAASRRAADFLWISLAVLGLLALLPLGPGTKRWTRRRRLCARRRAMLGVYILFGRKAGAAHGGQTTALGYARRRRRDRAHRCGARRCRRCSAGDFAGRARASRCCRARFPIRSEMLAHPRCRPARVGVLMSLEPALGALSGLCFSASA